MKRRQLISSREAEQAKAQHRRPCDDCPFTRRSLSGWLGSLSAEEWIKIAHGEGAAECHTLLGAQCAGLAVYRANVSKLPRDPKALRLPVDRKQCFASPYEFSDHHGRRK